MTKIPAKYWTNSNVDPTMALDVKSEDQKSLKDSSTGDHEFDGSPTTVPFSLDQSAAVSLLHTYILLHYLHCWKAWDSHGHTFDRPFVLSDARGWSRESAGRDLLCLRSSAVILSQICILKTSRSEVKREINCFLTASDHSSFRSPSSVVPSVWSWTEQPTGKH